MAAGSRATKPQAQWPVVDEIDGGPGENAPFLSRGSESDSDADSPRESNGGGWNGLVDFEGLPWWRTPSVWWLIVSMPIFTTAFGGIMVPKLNLILSLVCEQYFAEHQADDPDSSLTPIVLGGDNPQCNIPSVQRIASTFLLVMNLITGLLSAIVAPKMGKLSDRYGRRRLMAFSSCGGLVSEALTIVVAKYSSTLDYRVLILGSLCDGLCGSFTAGMILANSYVADCTPPSRRAVAIGWIQACLFGGLAFGPLISGYFIAYTGSLISFFYVALVCHISFILFIRFVTPDSLGKRTQRIAREKWAKEQRLKKETSDSASRMVQLANLFDPLKALWPSGPGTSPALRRNLVALVAADTIVMLSSMGAGAVILLYSKYMFDWDNLRSSQFISTLSGVRVFALMILLPILNYFGRIRPAAALRRASGNIPVDRNAGADKLDLWILRGALFSDLVGLFGYIFVRDGTLFFLSGMLTATGGLGGATTQAALTKHVPQTRMGQVLGAVGMVHALARVVGPVVFNGLYALTVEPFPQATFVLLAALFTLAIFAAFVIRPNVHWEEDEAEDTEPARLYPNQLMYGRDEPPQFEEDPLIVR